MNDGIFWAAWGKEQLEQGNIIKNTDYLLRQDRQEI